MLFYTNAAVIGDQLHYCGYDKKGIKVFKKEKFEPSIFIESNQGHTHRGYDGHLLHEKKMSLRDFSDYVRTYESCFPIYGNISPIYQFIYSKWGNEAVPFQTDMLRIYSFDIELLQDESKIDVNKAENEITAISFQDIKKGTFIVFSTCEFDTQKIQTESLRDKKIVYIKSESERSLLQNVVAFFKKSKPDALTGWYIEYFDIPYLYNRIANVLGANALQEASIFGSIRQKVITSNGKTYAYKDIGIPVYDFKELYKKFVYEKLEQGTLEYCANENLGMGKIKYDGDLDGLYRDNPQLFIEYNIFDTYLVTLLEHKLRLIDLAVSIAYWAKILYPDIFSPVKTWDVMVYMALKEKGLETLPFQKAKEVEVIGAYVFEPRKSMRKAVVSYDTNSLYPNVIISFNLDPMTIVDGFTGIPGIPQAVYGDALHFNMDAAIENALNYAAIKKTGYSYTTNGYYWKHDRQGIFGQIMESLYNERVKIKKQLKVFFDQSQYLKEQAIKILLNSGYGAFLNPHFRYYDPRIAEAITTSGRVLTRFLFKKIDEIDGAEVIYGDTDSVYISCEKVVEGIADTKEMIKKVSEFADKNITPAIEKAFVEITERLNTYRNTFQAKQEVVADKMLLKGKKMYIVRSHMDGGKLFDKPKMKYTGVEIVRTSTPMAIRKILKDMVNYIFNEDREAMIAALREYWKTYQALPVEDIASPRGVSDVESYRNESEEAGLFGSTSKIYAKGTPINSKAALIYNDLVKKLNLNYRLIYGSNKMKFIPLKTPNPIGEKVIGFNDKFPPEFGLDRYVDREEQFESSFLRPLEDLSCIIGVYGLSDIVLKQKNNLVNFF